MESVANAQRMLEMDCDSTTKDRNEGLTSPDDMACTSSSRAVTRYMSASCKDTAPKCVDHKGASCGDKFEGASCGVKLEPVSTSECGGSARVSAAHTCASFACAFSCMSCRARSLMQANSATVFGVTGAVCASSGVNRNALTPAATARSVGSEKDTTDESQFRFTLVCAWSGVNGMR